MSRRSAFTLVELLVALGVIVTLLAMLLPAVARARAAADVTRCASNLRQVGIALAAYAAENHWAYPPQTTSPVANWYDVARAGQYLPPTAAYPGDVRPGGGPYVCPTDAWGDVRTSYAVNVWSASAIDASVLKQSPASAVPWSSRRGNASRLMLVVEAYSATGSRTAGYTAPAAVGTAYASAGPPTYAAAAVTTPGERFGGAGGVLYTAGRYGAVASELCFNRHRLVPVRPPNAPVGRLNIAYADGHVGLRTDQDLVTAAGVTTYDSLWSPADQTAR